MRRRLLMTGGLTLLVACLAAWNLWHSRESASPRAASSVSPARDDAADFTGSQLCSACHADIARDFAQHPMAHSLEPARVQPPPADAAATFPAGRWTYQVEYAGQAIVHRELLCDAGGQTVTSQEAAVKYAIGSGIRGRSFVIERGGLFFQSPGSWYAQSQTWDLSPGYSPDQTTRFERRIGDDCLSCHAGRPHAAGGRADAYADPPFYETAIGCERCHGPGRRHV